MPMQEYELIEIRKDRFAKSVNGRVVGIATPGEVYCYFIKQKYRDIDPGVIEISIALTGIAGIIVTIQTEVIVRTFAGIAFVLGLIATSHLYWTYILMRIPITMNHYLRLPIAKRVNMNLWLVIHYPKLILRFLWFQVTDRGNIVFDEYMSELGYLTLLAALLLTAMASALFVLFDLVE